MMVEFITKDDKVIPINSSKNSLSSKQLGIGNEGLSSKSEKIESLMSTKQGGFPPTDTKAGIMKAWLHEEDFLTARKMMIEIIRRDGGIDLPLEDATFTATDRINGKDYSATIALEGATKRTGTSRHSGVKYIGFRLIVPDELQFKDKFEEKIDTTIKFEDGFRGRNFIFIPASNPSKINAIVPHLKEMISASVVNQSQNDVVREENLRIKEDRRLKIRSIHEELLRDLKREGMTLSKFEKEPREDDSKFNDITLTSEFNLIDDYEVLKVSPRHIKVSSKVNDKGEVLFNINEGFGSDGVKDLNEGQVLRILKIMKEKNQNAII